MSGVQIFSKKTNQEVIDLTAATDADRANFVAEKTRVANREQDVDASLSSIISTASADKAELKADLVSAEGRFDASLNSLDAKVDANKSSVDASLNSVGTRVGVLEQKVGDDLVSTVNSVLSEEIIQQTLDAYLATDSELSAEVSNAVNQRIQGDDTIKQKHDRLVDVLFEGLTFEGTNKRALQFNPERPPLLISSNIPLKIFNPNDFEEFVIGTRPNEDLSGVMVRAHFTLPDDLEVEYLADDGSYLPLVDVYGPEGGFPLGNINSQFRAKGAVGEYLITIEFKDLDGNVLREVKYDISVKDYTGYTNLIPDVDASGNALTQGIKGEFTFEFTTGDATQYDVYSITNKFSEDEEAVVSITDASGTSLDLVNVLKHPSGASLLNQNTLSVYITESLIVKFQNGLLGNEPSAVLTLEPNSTYTFKAITTYNDVSAPNNTTNPIDIALKLEGDDGVAVSPFEYKSFVEEGSA